MKLMNPGPVSLTERVRRALLAEDTCHREPEFYALTRDILSRLERVYDAPDHRAVLLTGSGTAAVEAMIGSLVPPGGRALVASNGVYGERAAEMLAAQGKAFEVVRSAWTDAIDVAAVEARLEGVSHVIAVHHETTTGRLNDLAALGRACAARGASLLVDAVSSFGAEEIAFENVEACAATANKCLHAVPGVAFVLASSSSLARPSAATSVYLDLQRYAREQATGVSPFTQAVPAFFALAEALRELEDEGGWEARRARYRARSARVVEAIGAEPLLDAGARSSVLTAFRLPAGVRYAELHDAMKRAGFVIYAGQGALADQVFRMAVMGDLGDADIERAVTALRDALD